MREERKLKLKPKLTSAVTVGARIPLPALGPG